MVKLEHILGFLDETFRPGTHPDYRNALNGLQVEGTPEVRRLGAAVDACEQTVLAAAEWGVDLLLVHHGLFWGGLEPITGPHYRKLATLIRNEMSLYSLHLPLDAHPELGNNALLLEGMGLGAEGPF
ncbi:MAG: Nif3-like dinuclear metal center hexameric protein, partial [Gemmatimonadota bacterium]